METHNQRRFGGGSASKSLSFIAAGSENRSRRGKKKKNERRLWSRCAICLSEDTIGDTVHTGAVSSDFSPSHFRFPIFFFLFFLFFFIRIRQRLKIRLAPGDSFFFLPWKEGIVLARARPCYSLSLSLSFFLSLFSFLDIFGPSQVVHNLRIRDVLFQHYTVVAKQLKYNPTCPVIQCLRPHHPSFVTPPTLSLCQTFLHFSFVKKKHFPIEKISPLL